MADRRRFIVTYDIRHPKRLRRTFTTMKKYGHPLQYSVFACDLSRGEYLRMHTELTEVINTAVDSIMIADLGEVANDARLRISYIGASEPTPEAKPTIL